MGSERGAGQTGLSDLSDWPDPSDPQPGQTTRPGKTLAFPAGPGIVYFKKETLTKEAL